VAAAESISVRVEAVRRVHRTEFSSGSVNPNLDRFAITFGSCAEFAEPNFEAVQAVSAVIPVRNPQDNYA
jgi:hypothetical protein